MKCWNELIKTVCDFTTSFHNLVIFGSKTVVKEVDHENRRTVHILCVNVLLCLVLHCGAVWYVCTAVALV